MESRRRLAILSSHILPPINPSPTTSSSSHRTSLTRNILSPSSCDSRPDGKNIDQEADCVFCKIVRGKAPALKLEEACKYNRSFDGIKLYEDDICLCILDTNPVSHGHSLIIPKCHFPSLAATPPSVVAAMCSKVPYISKAVMKATGSDSFNLLVNNGVAAGQVVFHTHIHIIPRNARDCLWASESLRRRPLKLDQDALHLVDNIRDHLSFSDNFEDSKDQGSSLDGG